MTSNAFAPLVSIYDATGQNLLAVASRTAPGAAQITWDLTAGHQYLVRVASLSQSNGAYALTVTTSYQAVPEPFDPNTNMVSVANVDVGPNAGARVYRFAPAPRTDVLAVQLSAAPGQQPVVILAGPDGKPIAGQDAGGGTLAFALSGMPGFYDLFVADPTSDNPVTIRIGQLDVPVSLPAVQFPGGEIDPITGALSEPLQGPGTFGQYRGVQYYQLLDKDPTATTTATVQNQNGVQPLLAHYQNDNGVFRLVGFETPAGQGNASLTDVFNGNQLQALAAFSLDLSGPANPTFQFNVQTPPPVGVQVGMVPDLAVRPLFQSILKIENVALKNGFQEQLWQTILPFNIVNGQQPNPTVVFHPQSAQGPVQAKITVYIGNQQIGFAQSDANNPAKDVTIQLNNVGGSMNGKTVLIRVEARGDAKLGTGVYTLSMHVTTTNPDPFLVWQKAWQFPGPTPQWLPEDAPSSNNNLNDPNYYSDHLTDPLTLPASVTDIAQNQFGHGEAQSEFTSSNPGTLSAQTGLLVQPDPGTVAVYRFWAINPGPVSVKTVAADDKNVNTNIHVYRAKYDANGVLYLGSMDHVTQSFDWYPADRSEIDAQTFINDFDGLKYTQPGTNPYGTGGGMYFVVVRNQEGSQGKYTIEVDTPAMPLRGNNSGQVTYVPPNGSIQLNLADASNFPVPGVDPGNAVFQDSLGYFPVQMPNFHDGFLTIAADEPAAFGSYWDIEAFSNTGDPLRISRSRVNFGPTVFSVEVPSGLQTVWLRVLERVPGVAVVGLHVTLSANVAPPVAAPPSQLPILTPTTLLPTNPFGDALGGAHDGQLHDHLVAAGDFKVYEFEAPGGEMTVNLAPDVAGDLQLRWGAYVNGQLIAWGLGDGSDNTFALPTIRPTSDSPDFDFDRSVYELVKLRIDALTPMTVSGQFTASVNSNAVLRVIDKILAAKPAGSPSPPDNQTVLPAKPLRDADLPIDSLTATGVPTVPIPLDPAAVAMAVNGLNWMLLSVPERTVGAAKLSVSAGLFFGGETIRYDLYDVNGNFLASDTGTANFGTLQSPPSPTIFQLAQATAGASYYLRVGLVNHPEAQITVTANVSFPISGLQSPPRTISDFNNPNNDTLVPTNPTPDGLFSMNVNGIGTALVPFWVGQGGMASVDAVIDPGVNNYVALYRVGAESNAGGPEFPHLEYDLTLVDFQDTARGNFFYTLPAYLDPRLYVLKASGNAKATLSAQLPAYPLTEIVTDPNSGKSFAPLDAADSSPVQDNGSDRPLAQSFRTTFYHTVAPPASLAGITASAAGDTLSQADDIAEPGNDTPQATLSVWTQTSPNSGFSFLQSLGDTPTISTPNIQTKQAIVTFTPAPPNQEYWLSFSRQGVGGKAEISAAFKVPQSGTPDLIVTDLRLTPDNGMTRVDVTLENHGFADADPAHALYTLQDGLNHFTKSDQQEPPLAAFGSTLFTFEFKPDDVSDKVTFAADSTNLIKELSETNNSMAEALSKVDKAPTLSLRLADPSLSYSNAIWGRYVSGADGSPETDILADVEDDTTGLDPAGGAIHVFAKLPAYGLNVAEGLQLIEDTNGSNPSFVVAKNFFFGGLNPTDPAVNPNFFKVYAEDAFGLDSPEVDRPVQVIAKPKWVTSVAWDDNAKQYQLVLKKDVLAYGDPNNKEQPITVADITGVDIPGIGSLGNQFLVQLKSAINVGLDPGNPNDVVTGPLGVKVKLLVVGQSVLDVDYDGTVPNQSNPSISTDLAIDQESLQPVAIDLTLGFKNVDLLHYQTPDIPLFSYGIPDVLALEIDLKFFVDVTMDAIVTIGFDPKILNGQLDPPSPLFVKAPTDIIPKITVGAEVSGSAKVLGFDLASISGSISFTFNVDIFLDKPSNQEVPLKDVISNLGVDLTGQIGVHFEATVLWFTPWSYTYDSPPFEIGGQKDPNVNPLMGQLLPGPLPTTLLGSAATGQFQLDPRPNLIIDPNNGKSLYVQVVNNDPNNPLGNLQYATGTGVAWNAPLPLPQPEEISSPALAWTHDGPNDPAVVVYGAMPLVPGKTLAQTNVNEALKGQDIRARYWDGSNWQSEQALTSDDRYDSEPALAFNNSGQGVAVWTRNINATPVSDQPGVGYEFGDNEIAAAVWDPGTHSFLPMQLVTDNVGISDSKPAAYAAPDGTLYVVWLQEQAGSSRLMYSVFKNGSWTGPAELAIAGLPAGGNFGEIAIGSSDGTNLNVLFNYKTPKGDGSTQVDSVLYSRTSTAANFSTQTPLEIVAQDQQFSHLRTLTDASGGMIVSWQQSDGTSNGVAAVRMSPALPGGGGNVCSTPMLLAANSDLTFNPSVALDQNGAFETVFQSKPRLNTPEGMPALPPALPNAAVANLQVGAGVASSLMAPKPELAFTQSMFFPNKDAAASGSTAEARAQIINRGLADATVRIEYYLGDPAQGGTRVGVRVIELDAGQSFDIHNDFQVEAGVNVYAIKVTPINNDGNPVAEAVTAADDVSLTTLTGMIDLAVTNVQLADSHPHEGEVVPIAVTVANLSDQTVGGFDVTLYQGDPATATIENPTTLIGTQHVAGLGPNQSTVVSFAWTVPAGGGVFTLAAVADPAGAIPDAVSSNNTGRAVVSVRPDGVVSSVLATALNYSGKNNVKVEATVANLGQANLTNMPIRVLWSLDDGPYQLVGATQVSLAAGSRTVVSFQVDGLAGRNRYRVILEPNAPADDVNWSNNLAEAILVLQELPDLIVAQFSLRETQTPTQGQTLTVDAQIRNVGIASAHAISVEVFAGNPAGNGFPIGKTTVDSFAAMSLATVSIPIDTSRLVGLQEITVIVNRFADFPESSHFNNSLTHAYLFHSKDATKPISKVLPLAATTHSPTFLVKWQGSDGPKGGASGIAFFDIYVSTDGGKFKPWLTHTTQTSAMYAGKEGHSYAFYSVATDNAGNRESLPAAPDAKTTIPPPTGVLRGVLYNDRNGNHKRDRNEPALAGWKVYLDKNNNGQFDKGEPTALSDANGAYSFTGLAAGSYNVAVVPKLGWIETSPGSPSMPTPPISVFEPASAAGLNTWTGHDPFTPAVIDIFYDFRSLNGFANQITPAEVRATEYILSAYSATTQGRIRFVENPTAPASDIITIGVGDLAAVSNHSVPGGVLGEGGATPHTETHTLSDGKVWLDVAENWDTTLGNGSPAGTFDFFAAVAHEIGHALGLGHGDGVMAGDYHGEFAGFSADNLAALQTLYPPTAPTGLPAVQSVDLAARRTIGGLNFGVRKLPPLLTLPSSLQDVTEGSNAKINFGSFTDIGAGAGPWTVDFNWGESSAHTVLKMSRPGVIAAPHTYLDNGARIVTLQITDGFGAMSQTTFTLPVSNAPPAVTPIAGPTQGVPGEPLSFSVSFADPGVLDTHAAFINWGDDSVSLGQVTESKGHGTIVGNHVYRAPGNYVIMFPVTDKDGARVVVAKHVSILPAVQMPDPNSPGQNALLIGGTTLDDTINVGKSPSGAYTVSVVPLGAAAPFTANFAGPIGRIYVWGQAGDDRITIADNVTVSAWLDGGDGADQLQGGGGNDILQGGNDNDLLLANLGRDFLLGGAGQDQLKVNTGEAILIGSSTVFDTNASALIGLLREWGRHDVSYATRVAHLTGKKTGGFNGASILSAKTLLDDQLADTLYGSPGWDLFFQGPGDVIHQLRPGSAIIPFA